MSKKTIPPEDIDTLESMLQDAYQNIIYVHDNVNRSNEQKFSSFRKTRKLSVWETRRKLADISTLALEISLEAGSASQEISGEQKREIVLQIQEKIDRFPISKYLYRLKPEIDTLMRLCSTIPSGALSIEFQTKLKNIANWVAHNGLVKEANNLYQFLGESPRDMQDLVRDPNIPVTILDYRKVSPLIVARKAWKQGNVGVALNAYLRRSDPIPEKDKKNLLSLLDSALKKKDMIRVIRICAATGIELPREELRKWAESHAEILVQNQDMNLRRPTNDVLFAKVAHVYRALNECPPVALQRWFKKMGDKFIHMTKSNDAYFLAGNIERLYHLKDKLEQGEMGHQILSRRIRKIDEDIARLEKMAKTNPDKNDQ